MTRLEFFSGLRFFRQRIDYQLFIKLFGPVEGAMQDVIPLLALEALGKRFAVCGFFVVVLPFHTWGRGGGFLFAGRVCVCVCVCRGNTSIFLISNFCAYGGVKKKSPPPHLSRRFRAAYPRKTPSDFFLKKKENRRPYFFPTHTHPLLRSKHRAPDRSAPIEPPPD